MRRSARVRIAYLVLAGAMAGMVVAAVGGPARASTTAAAAIPTTASDLADQTALAERYAPIVRLVKDNGPCGAGEPFDPLSVNVVLGSPDVALRGPWSGDNLVKVAPTAKDLSKGLANYNLDFPGNALSPGCTYVNWAASIQKTAQPTVYAHVATQASDPDHLALQYWFFYLYNDFNDKHEGDWEMIQLNFHAGDAQQALTTAPYETGYSQHEGAESAEWGDESKLELVDGTHPVVYPALGSHANYYAEHLYLGHSAAQGVGCDDTIGPFRELRPAVVVLPQSRSEAVQAFPWLGYRGRWGERHRSFANGPTGPATKARWSAPFTWVEDSWHGKAFAIPEGGVFGSSATTFFCAAVARGSEVYNATLNDSSRTIIVAIVLLAAVIWLASRTEWGPAVVYRVRRRRSWGAMVSSAMRMYWTNWRTFLGIGLVFVPLGIVVAVLQYALFDVGGLSALVTVAGRSNPAVELLVDGLGGVVGVVGLTMVQAATAYAVNELDDDRSVTARAALRQVAGHWRALAAALVLAAVAVVVLSLTLVGAVVAAYLVVRWSLLAQAVMIGDGSDDGPLRQSARATRGHLWRTLSVTVFITLASLLIGPLVGSLLLFVTNASFDVVNLVSALVEAVLTPLVAITSTYLYFDLRIRSQLVEQRPSRFTTLPAEG